MGGGNQRWKITQPSSHLAALSHIKKHCFKNDDKPRNIFCPLAGDDPVPSLLWSQGHSVTTIDLVPDAVDAMKKAFGGASPGTWTREERDNTVFWTHSSGRATLCTGDALQKRPEWFGSFDMVYDKD